MTGLITHLTACYSGHVPEAQTTSDIEIIVHAWFIRDRGHADVELLHNWRHRTAVPRLRRHLSPHRVRGLTIIAAAFLIAFSGDMSTDQRFSSYWGSAALLVSLWVAIPRLHRIALPAAAYLGAWVAFNLARAVADNAGFGLAAPDAVFRLESRLFGDAPTLLIQRHLGDDPITRAFEAALVIVHLSFFIVPTIIAIILYRSDTCRFWRYTLSLAALFAVGTVGFLFLPTDPPWLADRSVERIADTLLADLGLQIQADSGAAGYSFEPNHVASMPSVHLAVTAAILFATWSIGRGWRIGATLYTAAMGLALVALGEHYLLDVLAGFGVAALAWWIAMRFIRPETRRPTDEQPTPARVASTQTG